MKPKFLNLHIYNNFLIYTLYLSLKPPFKDPRSKILIFSWRGLELDKAKWDFS